MILRRYHRFQEQVISSSATSRRGPPYGLRFLGADHLKPSLETYAKNKTTTTRKKKTESVTGGTSLADNDDGGSPSYFRRGARRVERRAYWDEETDQLFEVEEEQQRREVVGELDEEGSPLSMATATATTAYDRFYELPLVHQIVLRGNPKRLEDLLQTAENPQVVEELLDTRNSWEWTPLHTAAYENKKEMAEVLLKFGAKTNSVTAALQRTPLHFALRLDDTLPLVRILLEAGADVNSVDGRGASPLTLAAAKRIEKDEIQTQRIKLLLEYGANPDQCTKAGNSIVCFLVMAGRNDLVVLMLEAGADPLLHGKPRWNLFLLACQRSSPYVVKFIVRRIIEKYGEEKFKNEILESCTGHSKTSLMMAVRRNSLEITEYLLGLGADPNAADQRGWTSLHIAAEHGCLECMRQLLKFGGDSMRRTGVGKPALHFAVCEETLGLQMTTLLLEEGKADVDAVDLHNWSALTIVTSKGMLDRVRQLLDRGARVDIQSNLGGDLGQFAIRSGNVTVLKLLMKAGVDIGFVNPGAWNALHVSLSRETLNGEELFEACLTRSNYRDSAFPTTKSWHNHLRRILQQKSLEGRSPILFAASYGLSTRPLRFLMELRKQVQQEQILRASTTPSTTTVSEEEIIDLEIKTWGGLTPLLSTIANDCLDAAKLLLAEEGVQKELETTSGNNILHMAAGKVRVCKYLFGEGKKRAARGEAAGGKEQETGRTGSDDDDFFLCSEEDVALFKNLLRKRDHKKGRTPLGTALAGGHANNFQYILNWIDHHCSTKDEFLSYVEDRSPLHGGSLVLLAARRSDSLDALYSLLKVGCSPELKDFSGRNPFQTALAHGCAANATMLYHFIARSVLLTPEEIHCSSSFISSPLDFARVRAPLHHFVHRLATRQQQQNSSVEQQTSLSFSNSNYSSPSPSGSVPWCILRHRIEHRKSLTTSEEILASVSGDRWTPPSLSPTASSMETSDDDSFRPAAVKERKIDDEMIAVSYYLTLPMIITATLPSSSCPPPLSSKPAKMNDTSPQQFVTFYFETLGDYRLDLHDDSPTSSRVQVYYHHPAEEQLQDDDHHHDHPSSSSESSHTAVVWGEEERREGELLQDRWSSERVNPKLNQSGGSDGGVTLLIDIGDFHDDASLLHDVGHSTTTTNPSSPPPHIPVCRLTPLNGFASRSYKLVTDPPLVDQYKEEQIERRNKASLSRRRKNTCTSSSRSNSSGNGSSGISIPEEQIRQEEDFGMEEHGVNANCGTEDQFETDSPTQGNRKEVEDKDSDEELDVSEHKTQKEGWTTPPLSGYSKESTDQQSHQHQTLSLHNRTTTATPGNTPHNTHNSSNNNSSGSGVHYCAFPDLLHKVIVVERPVDGQEWYEYACDCLEYELQNQKEKMARFQQFCKEFPNAATPNKNSNSSNSDSSSSSSSWVDTGKLLLQSFHLAERKRQLLTADHQQQQQQQQDLSALDDDDNHRQKIPFPIIGVDCEWSTGIQHRESVMEHGSNKKRSPLSLNFGKKENYFSKIALVQVCTGEFCGLFRFSGNEDLWCRGAVQASYQLPHRLLKILSDLDVLKVGLGIAHDRSRLVSDYGLGLQPVNDLHAIASRLTDELGERQILNPTFEGKTKRRGKRFEGEHQDRQQENEEEAGKMRKNKKRLTTISLKSMTRHFTGVQLAKAKHVVSSDWGSKYEPLNLEQVEYASDDARASLYVGQEILGRRGFLHLLQEQDEKEEEEEEQRKRQSETTTEDLDCVRGSTTLQKILSKYVSEIKSMSTVSGPSWK